MHSDLIESHSSVFFYAGLRFVFQLQCKTYAKKLGGAFCSLLLNDKQKKPFVFLSTMKPAKCPIAACFLHTFLLENEVQTSGKKYRAVTSY